MRAVAKQNSVAQGVSIETLNDLIVDAIQDIKGKEIVKLDLRNLYDAPTDFFIICEGTSNTQVRAISENVFRRVKDELGIKPTHTEGSQNLTWVLVDYFNVVLHVFHGETRSFYDLETLWGDAKVTRYKDI